MCGCRRLNDPVATIYGVDANNTAHAIVLTLSSPMTGELDDRVCLPHPFCSHPYTFALPHVKDDVFFILGVSCEVIHKLSRERNHYHVCCSCFRSHPL